MEKFEGWHVPSEKPALTDSQRSEIASLPKVVLRNNHFEQYIGPIKTTSAGETPKIITSPKSLLRFVRNTAIKNGVSPWEVIQAIRNSGIEDPKKLAKIDRRYNETIGYVSDIHGGDDEFFKKLNAMAENPPEVVIFEGDVVGNPKFEELQKLFYNWVNNHSKNELLKDKPNATDAEILNYAGTKPPEDGFNLKKGFLKLREYELGLEGKSSNEIKAILRDLSDHNIAEGIRKYAKYVHYGHYASNLPDSAKRNLAHGLEDYAKKVLDAVKKMKEKGTKVVMLEGNWDARAPIDFVHGTSTAEPLPSEKRLFNPKAFFETQGIPFVNSLTLLETKTTLQILLPFDAVIGFEKLSKEKLSEIKEKIDEARNSKKSIVMVVHGEPNWQVHNMTVKDAKPSGEHAQLISGFNKAIPVFEPDEIIYGHMHDVFTNEKGEKLDPNTKYALKTTKEGTTQLVDDKKDFGPDKTVASHMQFRKLAELKVSKRDKRRKILGFGGNRHPLKVSS